MPANSPIWKGLPPGSLAETPESGKFKVAERITYTQQLAGRYADAFSFAAFHPRGSFWSIYLNGGFNLFCVEDASVDMQKGGKGVVSVTYLFMGLAPADEFSLEPAEIQPAIERNPFFAELTQDELDLAHKAYTTASTEGKLTLDGKINSSPRKAKIILLIQKWLRGEKTYHLASCTFKHTIHSFNAPNGFEGGVIQHPFGAFAGYVSHAGLDWLRQADSVTWSNGIWKLTRTWVGAPSGHWDKDLYPAG